MTDASKIPIGSQDACLTATQALCNVCGRLGDAKIVLRDGRVHLVKWCRDHGLTEALVSSDAAWYLRSLAFVKPATRPRALAVSQARGCPTSCGLCPDHQQHTCVPIVEITGRCDLDCPICLVGHCRPELPEMTPEQLRQLLDHLLRYEARVNMLTLSGGEPTVHPRLLELVDEALRPEVGLVSLSTNGVRLCRDEELLQALVRRRVVISLQFDGCSPGPSATLRGRADLAERKLRLIDRILELGGRVSLTVTLGRGVNEGELPGILELLLGRDGIVSLMVQPLAHTQRDQGRGLPASTAGEPYTLPEVIDLLSRASRGVLRATDFTPLPCSHPTCFALTYLLKLTDGQHVALPRLVAPDDYLDIIKNQALLGTDLDTLQKIRDALYSLWSSDGSLPDREPILKTVRQLLLDLNSLSRESSHRELLDLGVRNVKSIFIHQFMDRATFDLSRAVKCCNHYPQIDGRLLPACIRNNLGPGTTLVAPVLS